MKKKAAHRATGVFDTPGETFNATNRTHQRNARTVCNSVFNYFCSHSANSNIMQRANSVQKSHRV